MRARLAPAWPGLAHFFGLYPDDIGRFSVQEWSVYLAALDEIKR